MKFKFEYIIYIIAILIIIFTTAFAWYIGFFTPVDLQRGTCGPFVMVYHSHIGPYDQTLEIAGQVDNLLSNKYNILAKTGYTIYYDDQSITPKSKLRSEAGLILLSDQIPDIDSLTQDFQVRIFPATECAYTYFPFKNNLSLDIGERKVYPKFYDYILQNNLQPAPVIQLYDIANSQIKYIMPIQSK